MTSFFRYWYTLRHLRPIQFFGRVWFKLYRPKPDLSSAPSLRKVSGQWVRPDSRLPSLLEPMTFCFFNETYAVKQRSDWDNPKGDKLLRYNLHYFDDLNAANAAMRRLWHIELLTRWVIENPPGQGTGWEPYPTSLRIVNWIKWVLAGNELPEICRQSLAVQARWLSSHLEIHLLGNHLFANAKALVFAGLFFKGTEASRWLEKGVKVLTREIPEQILPDGGHFERSTMYHALVLEDMLDLFNLAKAYQGTGESRLVEGLANWPGVIERMRQWLTAMCHPDGEISFFNDAAIGVASPPSDLERYAQNLGFDPLKSKCAEITHLKNSGYIRIERDKMVALLDVAPIGPDYLPGHAHADSLSFELSFFGQRLVVNSGTSCYSLSFERLRQRGTAAHNTVVIDHENSSEVWGNFRVARRAQSQILAIYETISEIKVTACHDGYSRLPGKNIHRRSWTVQQNSLLIQDEIIGSFVEAEALFHLHPSIKIEKRHLNGNELSLQLPRGEKVTFLIVGGTLNQVSSSWHPSFGCDRNNICLVVKIRKPILKTVIKWNDFTS